MIGDGRLAAKARLVTRHLELFSGMSAGSDAWTTTVAREFEAALPLFEQAGDESGLTLAWRLRSGIDMYDGQWSAAAVSATHVHRTRATRRRYTR